MQKFIANTYEIVSQIGAGNSGIVYKAYHRNLNKYVVLKKIKTDIKNLVNIRAEVDVLKNLKHSCLPQVLDFVEDNGDIYTVMDFIPGHSFKQYLDAGTKFPESSVIIWMKQMASTLCYLHNQKPAIIHSDLKPGNIMLMPDGNISIIDFNISFELDAKSAYVNGYTNGYAAPEQIEALRYNQNQSDQRKWRKIDRRADIYSLGATIYHIMTGSKPISNDSGYVEDIQKLVPDINEVFASIIMKCLEPNPVKRYQRTEEILSDLQNMAQKSSTYQNLIRKQKITLAVLTGCMIFSMVLTAASYFRIDREKVQSYNNAVEQEAECITQGNYEEVESHYQKAVKIFPHKLDAYLQKAIALNKQKKYDECIKFISDKILNDQKIMKVGEGDSVYYLLGDCYLQLENYAKAAEYYYSAIEINSSVESYYRDCAIAEAYCGNIQNSQNLLSEAQANGMTSVEVNYVQGEIQYSSGNYEGAEQTFRSCIEDSQDSYILMRSYIMEAKCIDNRDSTVNGKLRKAELLAEAKENLPKENNIGVLEELAQTYSDLGNATSDLTYYKNAISVFQQIKSQGMGDYQTDYNIAVLYQNMNDYENAQKQLTAMLQSYGEDYKTYKSLAFLEVAKQGVAANDQRDYSKFGEYYQKAHNLYQEQVSSNENDMEMSRLEELYSQAVSSGWISGSN